MVTDAPPRRSARGPSAAGGGERVRERLTHWAYLAGEAAISSLPRGLVLPVAAAAGNAAYDLSGEKGRVVRENLARAIGASPDDPRVRTAARHAFRAYAKYLADVMRMPALTPEVVHRLVTIDNVEIMDEARADGTGIVLCTVHVGGMDLIGPALKARGEELHVVADDTTYGSLYEHLKAVRAQHGLKLIGWRSTRAIFRVLHARGNLVLFCDGGFRRGDVPVEFLGEPTTFPAGPAGLSARTGAPMLPVYCARLDDERFRARGLPLIRCTSMEPAEIFRATQLLADELGSVIRENPSQWYMFRAVWPQTDADRTWAAAALASARRGEDWAATPI